MNPASKIILLIVLIILVAFTSYHWETFSEGQQVLLFCVDTLVAFTLLMEMFES